MTAAIASRTSFHQPVPVCPLILPREQFERLITYVGGPILLIVLAAIYMLLDLSLDILQRGF